MKGFMSVLQKHNETIISAFRPIIITTIHAYSYRFPLGFKSSAAAPGFIPPLCLPFISSLQTAGSTKAHQSQMSDAPDPSLVACVFLCVYEGKTCQETCWLFIITPDCS